MDSESCMDSPPSTKKRKGMSNALLGKEDEDDASSQFVDNMDLLSPQRKHRKKNPKSVSEPVPNPEMRLMMSKYWLGHVTTADSKALADLPFHFHLPASYPRTLPPIGGKSVDFIAMQMEYEPKILGFPADHPNLYSNMFAVDDCVMFLNTPPDERGFGKYGKEYLKVAFNKSVHNGIMVSLRIQLNKEVQMNVTEVEDFSTTYVNLPRSKSNVNPIALQRCRTSSGDIVLKENTDWRKYNSCHDVMKHIPGLYSCTLFLRCNMSVRHEDKGDLAENKIKWRVKYTLMGFRSFGKVNTAVDAILNDEVSKTSPTRFNNYV